MDKILDQMIQSIKDMPEEEKQKAAYYFMGLQGKQLNEGAGKPAPDTDQRTA